MVASAPFEVTLFGLPQLAAAGRTIHVGSRKALALVAWLAQEGESPRERLAQQLWADLDLPAARRNLRREVFRLRQAGLSIAASANAGLSLAADVVVDLKRFHAALASGDDEGALSISRGTLLDGLEGVAGAEFDSWLQRCRTQAAQQRLQARARHAKVLEQRGEHTAALALHLQAVVEDRCHEGAAFAAMRLLAHSSDRAAALAQYNQLVAALRDELGIEPGAATQALAAELRGNGVDSATPVAEPLAAASVSPALLAPKLPFVERAALQAQVEAAWQAGRWVYLSGVAGTGKTRLASECAAARGPWLLVACTPNDVELPFSSVVRVLRALRESAPDSAWPDWVRRELAQLMPELGPAPLPLATDEARARLVAAIDEAWTLGVRDNFCAVVLDDWHWCDAASAELCHPLGEEGVAWIVAYRSAQLPPVALQRMRADVDSRRAAAVQVQGLAAHEVLALVRLLSGSPGGALFAQRLQSATEGNPFFLIETLRFLFEQGLLTSDAHGGWRTPFDEATQNYAELPVPPTVRDTVLGRVRALGRPAQHLLEAASVLAGDFDLALLADAVPGAAGNGVTWLEHAHAARLVTPAGNGYRFSHDLVRQCLADGLSPARRCELHAGLARSLEAAGAPAALIAAQLEGAGRAAAAVQWRMAAAQAALRVHAHADALAQFALALADGATPNQAVLCHLGAAQVERSRGNAAAVEAALVQAVQAATDADADAGTRLQAQLTRAEHWCGAERLDDGLALLDALAGDLAAAAPPVRARALAARALVQVRRGQAEAAAVLEAEAIALLNGIPGAAPQLAELLVTAARAAIRRGDIAGCAGLAQRAVAVYEAAGDPGGLARALTMLGVAATFDGSPAQAFDVLERARALAARCGHVPAQRGAIRHLIKLHTDAGDTTSALALLEEGEALAPGFESSLAELIFMQARYYVHYLRGELSQARATAERLVAASDRSTDLVMAIGCRLVLVDLHLHTGELARARELIGQAVSARKAADRSGGQSFDALLLAKRAWLALAEGRPREALVLLADAPEAPRWEDRYLWAWVGAAAALATGDTDDAARRLDSVDIQADTATDALAGVLVQRLALARALARPDPQALQRAQSLLDAGRVPALEAQALRHALTQTP